MSSERLREAALVLGWSVFGEMGVPSIVRNHSSVALDPEPIVIAAPSLFVLDPRFRDQVYAWCSAHSAKLSLSRIRGLLGSFGEEERIAFASFALTLRHHNGVRWPTHEKAKAWPRVPAEQSLPLTLARPALLRFRIRALCGVGARADVSSELLARPELWTRSSQLSDVGYSKRSVAIILSELADAGIVQCQEQANALVYRLSRPQLLEELVGGSGLGFPSWTQIMRLVILALELANLETMTPTVRRVLADKLRNSLNDVALRVGLEPPPSTRGNKNAWEVLSSWTGDHLTELAAGNSNVLLPRSSAIDRPG